MEGYGWHIMVKQTFLTLNSGPLFEQTKSITKMGKYSRKQGEGGEVPSIAVNERSLYI